jgi:PAS domain S-box-containing protein
MAGRAWQEGEIVYLSDVPDNYIRITSGLGHANPTSLLMVPLKINDQIFGVVEMASFQEFKDFEKEFVQNIAATIASSISSVKINARTQRLLEESQQMTEQLRAQEEEMRQNMEELQTTQEEMERGQWEVQSTMKVIHEAMAVIEFDKDGTILKANENYLSLVGYCADEIVGESHRILLPKHDRDGELYRNFWKELSDGKDNRGEFKRVTKSGQEIWLQASYSPVRNKAGMVAKVMKLAYDITPYKIPAS